MLSMQEFGLYDEVPVAFAKVVKYIYCAHALRENYGDDGLDYMCEDARYLIFNGVFDVFRKMLGGREEAANNLIRLVLSFGFRSADEKPEKDFLISELKRLNDELRLCYISAEKRYEKSGEGAANLKAGLREITISFLGAR